MVMSENEHQKNLTKTHHRTWNEMSRNFRPLHYQIQHSAHMCLIGFRWRARRSPLWAPRSWDTCPPGTARSETTRGRRHQRGTGPRAWGPRGLPWTLSLTWIQSSINGPPPPQGWREGGQLTALSKIRLFVQRRQQVVFKAVGIQIQQVDFTRFRQIFG